MQIKTIGRVLIYLLLLAAGTLAAQKGRKVGQKGSMSLFRAKGSMSLFQAGSGRVEIRIGG